MKLRVSEVAFKKTDRWADPNQIQRPITRVTFHTAEGERKGISQFAALELLTADPQDNLGFEVGEEYEFNLELVEPDINPLVEPEPKQKSCLEPKIPVAANVEVN